MNPADETARAFAAFAERRYPDAVRHARRVLDREPGDRACLTLLGRVALVHGEPEQAEALFRQVLAQPGQVAASWLDLERALSDQRRHDAAREALQRALEREPGNLQALLRSGAVNLAMGDEARAREDFERCLAQQPRCLPALKGLGQLGALEPGSAALAQARAWLEDPASAPLERAELHYILAQVHRRRGESEAFTRHLFAANREQRRVARGSREDYRRRFEALDRAYTADALQAVPEAAAGDVTPIFVLGMPRSGTTLVEQLIAAHPDVASGGEIDYLRQAVPAIASRDTGETFPGGLARLSATAVDEIARAYRRRLVSIAAGRRYVCDKTPGNYHLLGLLPKLFPDAPIVHVRRDPMATCFSILQQPFDLASPHTCDVELLAYVYAHYRRLMARWESLVPGFLTVDYEQLVARPAEEAARIYRHCGLQWQPRYLDDFRHGSAVQTFSAVQVRRPIGTGSVGAWRRYESALAPLREALDAELG